jgi:hypothetical protein
MATAAESRLEGHHINKELAKAKPRWSLWKAFVVKPVQP